MQRNIDGQFSGCGIEVSRGEVAGFQIAPFARNIEPDVIVRRWGREILEIIATKDDSHHPRREILLIQDHKRPAARIVPDAAGSVFHISVSGSVAL